MCWKRVGKWKAAMKWWKSEREREEGEGEMNAKVLYSTDGNITQPLSRFTLRRKVQSDFETRYPNKSSLCCRTHTMYTVTTVFIHIYTCVGYFGRINNTVLIDFLFFGKKISGLLFSQNISNTISTKHGLRCRNIFSFNILFTSYILITWHMIC